jgi:hypothetical protein
VIDVNNWQYLPNGWFRYGVGLGPAPIEMDPFPSQVTAPVLTQQEQVTGQEDLLFLSM